MKPFVQHLPRIYIVLLGKVDDESEVAECRCGED